MNDRKPTMTVCPSCGPKQLLFAGRVIQRLCERCRKEREA